MELSKRDTIVNGKVLHVVGRKSFTSTDKYRPFKDTSYKQSILYKEFMKSIKTED